MSSFAAVMRYGIAKEDKEREVDGLNVAEKKFEHLEEQLTMLVVVLNSLHASIDNIILLEAFIVALWASGHSRLK
jgi:hypothetical protein